MKKIFILIFLLSCCTLILYANPIMPAYISEIYFDDNDDWTIELYDYYQLCNQPNLDDCYIESTTNLAYFNNGITFTVDDTLLITNDDMQTDLIINREGDHLIMGGWTYDEICWGNYSNLINSPYPGQSLVKVPFYTSWYPSDDPDLYLAKDNEPSLGYNPFDAQTRGGLAGVVLDGNGVPVYNAEIIISPADFHDSPIYTDVDGSFSFNFLYALNYNLSTTIDGYPTIETTVSIEPDSTSNLIISPDCSIEQTPTYHNISVSNHPNPFYDKTEIHYSLPHNSAGSITIFNSKGQKIREIAVSPNENSISWSGLDENNTKVPSGVYFYQLESDDKTLASGKMLYLI